MKRLLLALPFCIASAVFAADLVWEPLGEPNCGGWSTSLEISPHDSQRVLIGGDMLGAGLSTDGGKTWGATTGFSSWEINDSTWHPTDPKTAWFGTLMGPYKSTDSGRTWTSKRAGFPKQLNFGFSAPVEKIVFDPNDASHLVTVCGSSRGWDLPGPRPPWGAVWESRDAGETWKRLSTIGKQGSMEDASKGVNIYGITFAAGSSTTLYAVAPSAGFFVSTNAGKTWTLSNSGLPHSNTRRVVAHPKDGNTVFISLGGYRPAKDAVCVPGGVYKSTDGGQVWTSISSGLAQAGDRNENFTSRYEAFAVAPSDPDIMYAADTAWTGDKIYVTKNGGKSWQVSATGKQVRRALPAGLAGTWLSVNPRNANVAFNIGAEHILATHDGGTTWQDVANTEVSPGAWRGHGYPGWCAESVRFNPFQRDQVILQALDAGRVFISDDGMQSWRRPLNEPQAWGGGEDVVFTRDGTIFATTGQHGSFFGIARSRDGGKTWSMLHGSKRGLPEAGWNTGSGAAAGIYALPHNSSNVWACIGGKLFQSGDAGHFWNRVSLGPDLQWLAGDPPRKRVYLAGGKNVYFTEDGRTWIAIGGPHKPGRMCVDSAGALYLAAAEGERSGIWRWVPGASTNGTWTRLNDERWAANIAVDPTNPNRLAMVCNQNPYTELSQATGVWLSSDAGKSWFQANDSLPMLRLVAVAFNPFKTEELIVGTFGRGYFKTMWPTTVTTAATRSYKHTDSDTKFAAVTPEQPKAGFKLVVKNGSFTQGDDLPVDWRGKFGEIKAARDTNTFKSAPAALRVTANGKNGQAFQTIQGGAGAKFKIVGWIKTQGNVKAQAAVQAFADGYKNNKFIQLQFVQGAADWAHFEKEVELPDWTAFFNIGLMVEGTGSAWLDDVHEASEKVDEGKPQSEREKMTSGAPPKDKP